MELKLVIVEPEIMPNEFRLELPITIGRSREAKIKLVHGQISRLHCEIVEVAGEPVLRDLGSLNGTFVDGQQVGGEQLLEHGSLLGIGSVTLRVVRLDAPVPAPAVLPLDTVRSFDTLHGAETPSPPMPTMQGNRPAASPAKPNSPAKPAAPKQPETDDTDLESWLSEPAANEPKKKKNDEHEGDADSFFDQLG